MNKGITLVEMLVATSIVAILSVSVGAGMVAATRMSLKAREPLELKKDVTFALKAIQRRVRPLSLDEIEISEDGDTLTMDDGSESPPYFAKVGRDLVFFDGGQTDSLISDKVEAVTFALVEGHRPEQYLLSVALEVSHADSNVQIESLTKLRN